MWNYGFQVHVGTDREGTISSASTRTLNLAKVLCLPRSFVPLFDNFFRRQFVFLCAVCLCVSDKSTQHCESDTRKMGNKLNKEKKPKDLNELLQSTRFSEEEIKNWYRNFLKVFLLKKYPIHQLRLCHFGTIHDSIKRLLGVCHWFLTFQDFPKGQVTKRQFQILYSQQFPAGDAQTVRSGNLPLDSFVQSCTQSPRFSNFSVFFLSELVCTSVSR